MSRSPAPNIATRPGSPPLRGSSGPEDAAELVVGGAVVGGVTVAGGDAVVELEELVPEDVVPEDGVPEDGVPEVPEEPDEPEVPEGVPGEPGVVPEPFPVPPPWGCANGSWYWSSPALCASAGATGEPRARTRARAEAMAVERRMIAQGRSDSGGGRNFPPRPLQTTMPMPRALQRLLPTLLALGTLATITPARATAGTYDVYSCRTPAGFDSALSGWTGTANEVGGVLVTNTCGEGGLGSFGGAVTSGPAPEDQAAQWRFDAPANTTIDHYTMLRSVRATSSPGGAKAFGFFEDEISVDQQHLIDTCAPASALPCTALGDESNPFADSNRLVRTGRSAHRLFAIMKCTSYTSCGASASNGRFRIYQAQIGLKDDVDPSVAALGGDLLGRPGAVGGAGVVSFSAFDLGGGIESAELLVDGTSLAVMAMQGRGAGCTRPFTAVVPCPFSTSGDLPLDTARLGNGLHRVQVRVTDAGGNVGYSTSALVTTRNAERPALPNGSIPDKHARLSVSFRGRQMRTVRFGRTYRASGRLTTAGGQPIAGARVAASSRLQQAGARWRVVAIATTGSRGGFGFRPRRGASRSFRFAYRAYSSDRRPAAARTIRLRVRAGIRLSVRPRFLRNGRTAAFRVRLLGGPGRKGTLVSVQVMRPQRTTFATRGAGRNGIATVRHRFRYTYRPTSYLFRAVVQSQRGYPYLGATSGLVRLRVRP